MVTLKEIKEAIECSQELGDDELCFEVLNKLQDDPRLSDDPLTALASVMRHHGIEFEVETSDSGIPRLEITSLKDHDLSHALYGWHCFSADDIKPLEDKE